MDFEGFLGHTQVGEVVLVEKTATTAIIACGWDEYVTKILITEDDMAVLDTNLEKTQLHYTKEVIGGYRSFLWNMIHE